MKRSDVGCVRRAALPLVALAVTLAGGCDKLGFGDDNGEAAAEEGGEAETKASETKEADAKATESKDADAKEQSDLAKKAEEAKAKAEADAKAKAEADAKAAADKAKLEQPLILSDLEVSTRSGMFGGGSGTLELKAKAKLNEKIASSTYIHVKSRCKKDDAVVADVGTINADYTKPLDSYEAGDEVEVTGMLYSQGGLKSALSPCQLEFRLGGYGGGISVPVGEMCWDGAKATDGTCDPEIVAVAMSGTSSPLEITDLELTASGGYGGSTGLDSSYMIKIAKPPDSSARITMKTACPVDSVKYVDLSQVNMMSGPFEYGSGESLARSATMFWNPSFGFTGPPDECDVTFDLWTTKAGAWGSYDQEELQLSCMRSGKVTSGACDPSKPTTGPAAKVTKDNLEISNVEMSLQEPYGSTGKYQLTMSADATVKDFIEQNEGVSAEVTCKVKSEKRIETAYLFSVELYYLDPGETTKMSSTSFSSPPMDAKPRSCQVNFTGGRRFAPSGDPMVDLGTYCLKKDKVKKGKC